MRLRKSYTDYKLVPQCTLPRPYSKHNLVKLSMAHTCTSKPEER